MRRLNEILADLIQSIAMDAASSAPGLFTLATVVRHLQFSDYLGKGEANTLTRGQQIAVRNWLRDNCERRVINGQVYFRLR